MSAQPKSKCDPDIFEHGVPVLVIMGLASTAIEAQVVRWREETEARIDWHYVGGRAVVKVSPDDVERARAYIQGFAVHVVRP